MTNTMLTETSDYSCAGGCGGKCGCPNCPDMGNRKSSMMSLGYTEEAVDAVLFAQRPQDYSENEIVEMVMGRLQVIQGRAAEMQMVLEGAMRSGEEVEIEQWMIDKVTLAADYISAAADSAKYGNGVEVEMEMPYGEKKGLWDNIHAKRKRIKAGSGERMRKPGSKGAPSAKDLKDAAKDEKFGERKRPDYPDVDNDNNRQETMESAVKNAKMKRKKAMKAGIKID